ncbi:hypothetical protein K4K57_004389 [Colletotrichum sp. SAR 10_99]|nr:hypothetical protein K4K55_005960 [Colletotrichum sp. SAR 10_96]KAJ5018632.1 hypothetical protein K4K57_004389 [Colletotrichum sp. SAR 10_99]
MLPSFIDPSMATSTASPERGFDPEFELIQPPGASFADVLAFEADYVRLFMDETPSAEKKEILHVVCGLDRVLPYRAQVPPRIFPPQSFYDILLQNEVDLENVTFPVKRCVAWFHTLTIEQADDCIERVRKARENVGRERSGLEDQPRPTAQPKRSRKAKSASIVDHQHPLLLEELTEEPTMTFRKIIGSSEEFLELSDAHTTHIRREKLSDAENADPTWPSTAEEKLAYVEQAVMAIYDVSDFVEKTSALEKKARIDSLTSQQQTNHGEDEARPSKKRKLAEQAACKNPPMGKKIPKLNPVEAVLASSGKSPKEQLKAILRHELKDFEAEYLG